LSAVLITLSFDRRIAKKDIDRYSRAECRLVNAICHLDSLRKFVLIERTMGAVLPVFKTLEKIEGSCVGGCLSVD
jgi:hypothetical protein